MKRSVGIWLLFFALVLGLALRAPGWYTAEEMARWRLFEVDEEQHVAIAMHRFNDLAPAGADTIRHSFKERNYNVEGYGRLVGNLAYVRDQLGGGTPSFGEVVRLGRVTSTVFSLLLIVVVFGLGRVGGLPPPAAGVAALLLAACDLNATYAHYMLPAAGYVFFCWLALYGGLRTLAGPGWSGPLLLALGAAGAVAWKFDVFPLGWGGLLLLYLKFGRPKGERLGGGRFAGAILMLLAFLWLLTVGWTWDDIIFAFTELSKVNRDVVEVDDHFRDNLVAYPLAVLTGIGLPAFCLAIWASVVLLRQNFLKNKFRSSLNQLALIYVGGFVLTEALLRWYMDATFVRRSNVFMPVVALLTAYALYRLRVRPWVTALVVAWSVGLAVVGQSHHWFDTRIAMRDYANEYLRPPLRVGTAAYVNPRGFKNWRYFNAAPFDYLVVHESWYRRYGTSLTTPFGFPDCETGVYHGGKPSECYDVQAMLRGEHPNLVLHRAFRSWDIFPERLLYKYLFGYYETFLGDTLIFRRVGPMGGKGMTS